MLEIVLLHRLCRGVGRFTQAKGLPKVWFQALVIAAWIGGEVYGGVASAMLHAMTTPMGHHEAPLGLMYASAVLCAACGAGLIFGLAWLLPARKPAVVMVNCGHCGEGVSADHVGCPLCGQPLCAQTPGGATMVTLTTTSLPAAA